MVLLEIDLGVSGKILIPTRGEMPTNEKSKPRRDAQTQNSKTDILILGSPADGFVRNGFMGYPENEKSKSRRDAQHQNSKQKKSLKHIGIYIGKNGNRVPDWIQDL